MGAASKSSAFGIGSLYRGIPGGSRKDSQIKNQLFGSLILLLVVN